MAALINGQTLCWEKETLLEFSSINTASATGMRILIIYFIIFKLRYFSAFLCSLSIIASQLYNMIFFATSAISTHHCVVAFTSPLFMGPSLRGTILASVITLAVVKHCISSLATCPSYDGRQNIHALLHWNTFKEPDWVIISCKKTYLFHK